MLRSLKSMMEYALKAEDGDIGSVIDFFFDDAEWKMRFMQADTGGWLQGKKVLISPESIGNIDWRDMKVPVNLSKDKIRESPEFKFADPMRRPQWEMICKYYGWNVDWYNSSATLRSLNQVSSYKIHARDGMLGNIDDMILEDETWTIRYFVVDISGLLFGKKVLMSPQWVDEFVDEGKEVRLDVMKDKVKSSPIYDPDKPINREYEAVVFDYMGKPSYWRDVKSSQKKNAAGKTTK
ncbi:MAG: PRC-barrel domain-containing protein [Candidatus Altiarchaeota archaeon]